MKERKHRLSELKPGQHGVIDEMKVPAKLGQRLSDMGVADGNRIECMYVSPLGDPTAYLVKGTLIAVRREDAEQIWLREEENELE